MARKTCVCGFCENINHPSVCAACVNRRLNDKYKWINALQNERDTLHKTLDEKLKAKDKAGEQRRWMLIHAEKIEQLKERLRLKENQLLQEKSKLEEKINESHSRETFLHDACSVLEKNAVEKRKKHTDEMCSKSAGHTMARLELLQKQSIAIKQLCRVFPLCKVHDGGEKKDGSNSENYYQICNVRLPQGTRPHSVSPEELGASLGYMLQLLNLVVRYLYAPLLLNSGFAGSCSRVWQRTSYWDSVPLPRSEHPLFIPLQNGSTASQGNSWSEQSSSDYGVASMESSGRPHSVGSSSFNYGSSSLQSIDTHKDLKEGIFLLKKSVACVTAYFYNSCSLPPPTRMTTFEAFEKLLSFVSSKDPRAFLSSKESKSR
uniref:Uncharacterized protein n=1 Tax=Araucaria cunninghamii TaxID=56994 RepID=A0A0D6R5N9_ARACU